MQCDYFLPYLWVEAILKLDHLLLGSLPCLIRLRCLKDTCVPEDALLKDPRRLYAPGRIYHIVERKSFRELGFGVRARRRRSWLAAFRRVGWPASIERVGWPQPAKERETWWGS